MRKWAVQDQKEFEARQGCFEFGDACRFVAELAAQVKASISGWATRFIKAFRAPRQTKKPEQFRLDLDGLAPSGC